MSDMTRGLAATTIACALLTVAACSKGGKVEDFTPPADNARKALEAALKHWQAGQSPGAIPGSAPPIHVVDSKWKAGQTLKAFEILGEDRAAGTGPRVFKVRLTFDQGSPQEVRYVVFGIDPLWVHREDDYKKMTGSGM